LLQSVGEHILYCSLKMQNADIEVLIAYLNYRKRELLLSIFRVESILPFDHISFDTYHYNLVIHNSPYCYSNLVYLCYFSL